MDDPLNSPLVFRSNPSDPVAFQDEYEQPATKRQRTADKSADSTSDLDNAWGYTYDQGNTLAGYADQAFYKSTWVNLPHTAAGMGFPPSCNQDYQNSAMPDSHAAAEWQTNGTLQSWDILTFDVDKCVDKGAELEVEINTPVPSDQSFGLGLGSAWGTNSAVPMQSLVKLPRFSDDIGNVNSGPSPGLEAAENLPLPDSNPCLDQVCYGMISTLKAQLFQSKFHTPVSQTQATVSRDGKLITSDSLTVGNFDSRGTGVMQALSDDEAIDIQVLITPITHRSIQRHRSKTHEQPMSVNIIVYGPAWLSDDIGEFFQACDLYLQDPRSCDRNVPYCNPHCLTPEEGPRMTFDLVLNNNGLSVSGFSDSDVLDAFIIPVDLPEFETPLSLRTELLPHQKQALYFMTRRELGWNMCDPGADLWAEEKVTSGSMYINNVTNERHAVRPHPFSGGVLADAMGLGKSCSMIALIANDLVTHELVPPSTPDYSASSAVRTTLLIVPPSLIQTWEDQFRVHLKHTANLRISRHHGTNRIIHPHQLHHYDVIITTYQTVESEWRKCVATDRPLLFSAYWRRIILDEAHYVRDNSTNTSKAICSLQGGFRWAVTGTPLQNRLGDLATLCQFLRVYPYDDPRKFDSDIVQVWKGGSHTLAVGRLKRLLRYILLRRAKGTIELPRRTDQVISLDFSDDEAAHYQAIQGRVLSDLDVALAHGGSPSHAVYLNVLQQINELRLVCDLGVHRKRGSKRLRGASLQLWDSRVAQAAFETLLIAGPLTCTHCSFDLSTYEVETMLGSDLRSVYSHELYQCLRIVCASCCQQGLNSCCDHSPHCPKSPITYNPSNPRSGASSPSSHGSACEELVLSTKVEALILDLSSLSTSTKSVVFSYWTSTLDLIEEGLHQASITYVRYDGTTSSHNRNIALRSFRQDPIISVILMTISCASVGLDITVASRAYIMEPQWNPTVEEQALARVYRMGQTKEVTTTRFVMEGSFEQHVVETQHKKRELAELLLSPDHRVESENSLDRLRYFRSLLR